MQSQSTMGGSICPPAYSNAISIKQQTSGTFTAFQCITSSCHAILNTQLKTPSPKPEWFDGLEGKLNTAKTLSTEWLNELAPEMTSKIPTQIIDYGSTFRTVSDKIVSLLMEHPNARGKDHPAVKEVTLLITTLINKVNVMLDDVNKMDQKLQLWSGKMQQAHQELQDGAMNIQKAYSDLAADITRMNNAIDALKATIDTQRSLMTGALLTAGIGLFVGSIGIGLAPFTFGGSLVVGGLGGLAFVGGIGVSVYLGSRINEEMKEIIEKQKTIKDNERQIVALGGLYMATYGALSSIGTATEKVSEVKMVWSTFKQHLENTVKELSSTDEKLSSVINAIAVKTAQNEWANAVGYARELMVMQVTVVNTEVSLAA